uniref:Uncharacterized protein n=1 Tax=Suricata suricatta TaxID=37032 RepID=A0A673UZ22_SURSU
MWGLVQDIPLPSEPLGPRHVGPSRRRSGRDLQQYQSQAKQLFCKLNEQSPTRWTLEAGAMTFRYIIEQVFVIWFCVKLPFLRNWLLPT